MPAASPLPAIVLAGGKTTPEFAAESGSPMRAQADINGWPMVRYVVQALRAAASIGPVIVVAPTGFPVEAAADHHLVGDGSLVENMRAGLQLCGGHEFALLVSADIPFISPRSVDEHVALCLAQQADLCYAAIPREACLQRFPNMRRTYLYSADGTFTGGNLVLQRVSAFEREAELVSEAYRARKNPLFLARLIGPSNLLKFALRRLRLRDIELAAGRIMGVQCRLVVTPHADLGTDVDKPDDLRLARTLLKPA